MSSGSRPGGGPPEHDGAVAADARVTWHRSSASDQVVLGVEADGVRVAVAFPADAGRTAVRAVLDERDRELQHYFDTRDDDR